MRFLKVLFWLLLGGLVAGFIIYNGDQRVSIQLWSGLIADFSLPLLLIVTFLAGLLPILLAYHAMRWRLRQRIVGLERVVNDLRSLNAAPTEPAITAPTYPETQA